MLLPNIPFWLILRILDGSMPVLIVDLPTQKDLLLPLSCIIMPLMCVILSVNYLTITNL